MKDYAAIATQYARDVVEGRVLVGKWIKLAAKRHLDDLARAEAGWRYVWNPELVTIEGKKYRPADRVCMFIELLPHIKGDWAARGERIRLESWQVFWVASTFGWIDRTSLKRRFRVSDLIVPRKNSKSTVAAGCGLYMLTADQEFGPEVYAGATTENQAGEVFRPAKLMARASPDLLARFGVIVRESNISVQETNGKFEPIIGKPGDGASPSCALVDEYHEHPTEDLYDTMRTGMLARSQPLTIVTTTAGDDVSGPCYAHQEELQQILEGVIEDERRFGLIYTIDPDDDWTAEEALIKANPNLGISVDAEELLLAQRDAIRDPRKQATFKTKHLNLWVQSSSPWLNLQEWRALGNKDLRLEQFAGMPAYQGLDLANVTDIASQCVVVKRTEDDGEEHYYAFWRHYLPEAVIEEPDNKHYQGWHREGWLIATPGSMIDQARIREDVVKDNDVVRTMELALDAWGSPGISAALAEDGFEVVRVPQNVQHLSAPMKHIDGLVKSRRLHHCGDPVATWGVSNVEVKPDRNDNWFPRRGTRKKKIDPALALILAISRAMLGEEQGSIDAWLKKPVIVSALAKS